MSQEYVVTFGEIMGRFMPRDYYRLRQVIPGSLDITFGGAEANVAVSVARLGMKSRFVTALPEGPLTEACTEDLRSHGVEVSRILVRDEGRFGLYFVERGTNQRPSRVTYDRDGSTVALTGAEAYRWEETLADATWFHVTGITPAISATAAEATIAAVKAARARGIPVSMDLNYRKKLWRWEEGTSPGDLAGRVTREILPFVDLLIGNEGDAEDVLGIRAGESSVESGDLDVDRYPDVASQICGRFPSIRKVAITLRESISADHNRWGAMLYDSATGRATFAPVQDGAYSPYDITDIVDRVGGGDAFGAGLIRMYAGRWPGNGAPSGSVTDEEALTFAVAASCLAHSITGDYNITSYDEVMALAGGSGSGRVVR